MFVSIPVDGQVVAWGTFYESWKAIVFTAILRTKCNLTGSGVSSRILMELSESVSLFSLPAAHSAVPSGAGNALSSFCFFLGSAHLSSHQLLTVIPIKRQELLCLFHCLLYLVRSVTVSGKAMIYKCVPLGNVPLWERLHWDAGKV